MKLTRNKTIAILGLWMFSVMLNLFSFGGSFGEVVAYGSSEESNAQVQTDGHFEAVVVVATASPSVSVTTAPGCSGTVDSQASILQNSTSAFLMVPQHCFAVAQGTVAFLPKITVVDSIHNQTVAVQVGFSESFSVPSSFRGVPPVNFEVILPFVQTTAEKTSLMLSLVWLVFAGLSLVVRKSVSNLDMAYLQVFRC